MAGNRRGRTPRRSTSAAQGEARLRVVGGQLRGRSFRYNGDPGLRPMKDRVREAVFNLVGPAVKGTLVVDLFAGTGAMSFEAISRGASRAALIERKFPNVRLIEENARGLGIAEQVDVQAGDTFLVYRGMQLDAAPWLVFCCPPYDFYQSRGEELLGLIEWFCNSAPPGSLVVVESDERFDPSLLPEPDAWDVRVYRPAVIGLFECSSSAEKVG